MEGLPCVAQRVWATPQYNTRDLTSSFGSRFREQRAIHCILESLLVYSFALVHSIDTHIKKHPEFERMTTFFELRLFCNTFQRSVSTEETTARIDGTHNTSECAFERKSLNMYQGID